MYFYFSGIFNCISLFFQPLIAPLLYGQIMAVAARNMTIRYVITKQIIAGLIGCIVQTTLMALVEKQTMDLQSTTIRQNAQIISQVYKNSTTDLTSKNIIELVEDITHILMYNIKFSIFSATVLLDGCGRHRVSYWILDL